MAEDPKKPAEPEIVSPVASDEQLSPASRSPLLPTFSRTAWGAGRTANVVRRNTDAIRAVEEYEKALFDLQQTDERFANRGVVFEADRLREEQERLNARAALESARAAVENAKADGRYAAEIAEEEHKLRLLELRLRRAELQARLAPPDARARHREAIAKKFEQRLGQSLNEHDIRGRAAQLVAEIKERAGGDVTESVQREIDNVTDVMNTLLNEL